MKEFVLQEIWVLDSLNGLCSNQFLFYLVQTHRFNQIANVSTGTKMPRADWGFISDYPFAVPPKEERERICKILSTWDDAISTLEQLIQAKMRYKKGLMQQLLSGKKQFREFEGEEWEEVKLGDLLKEVKRDIEWDDSKEYDLISVKRRSEGVVHRESLYGHEIKTKNLKKVRVGDFIISRMQIVHGASALATNKFDGTMASGSYHTLVARNPQKINIDYFNYLSQTPYLYHLAYISSHGVHIEKMSFKLKDYLKKRISIPSSVEEQKEIVSVLDNIEKQIEICRRKLQAVKEQKKGLMQKLLTGKVRVNNVNKI